MNNDIVMIQLDRQRQLYFGYTALKTLTAISGIKMDEIDDLMDTRDFDKVELLVYCGLLKDARDHGETLKQEDIPRLLDEAPSFVHVVERIIKAWTAAFPAPEGNEEEPAAQPANRKSSTGKKASA